MNELLGRLCQGIDNENSAAFCLLVETRGSTPQKPGAGMLVYSNGAQAGTLGGGCVEAEVKRRAISVLEQSDAEILKFQLDNDYGWDDGLICGGRMNVLVEPVRNKSQAAFFRQWHDLARQGLGCTVAVVFDSQATELPQAACYLLDRSGNLITSLRAPDAHGGGLEVVQSHLKPLSERPRAYAVKGISYLPMLPRCRLLIVGGGHVGQAVGELAADLDFDVWVMDDRPEYVSQERFSKAQRRISGNLNDMLPEIDINGDTYCLIVTRGHNHDEEALYHLIGRGARYVGMIGSKRKIKLIFDDLLNEGISAESLARVHAPVGLDIGSQTVAEIAVSIAAELIAHRNLGGRVPGRDWHETADCGKEQIEVST